MDPFRYEIAVQALAQPLGEMADNLAYILSEVQKLELPEDLARRAAMICERFRLAIDEERTRAVGSGRPRLPAVAAENLFPALIRMGPRLQQEVNAFDALVRDARGAARASPLFELLLNESGANILTAFRALRDRLASLEANPPDRTDERCELPCAVCNQPAVRFDLDVNRSTGHRILRYSGITCAYEIPIRDDLLAWARSKDASSLHDHLPEGMDAYCPACKRVYCRAHYQTEETYDEGFYDSTYGTCPAGHRRMIDD